MSSCNDFSEISVLIPGYSIEDLPTDLPEEGASSLLNAIACAWHPQLIQRSTSTPQFRQAESLSGYPGRRIVLIPSPSESWMPHEWRSVFRDQGHVVIDGCTTREEWLVAIDEALAEISVHEQPSDPDDTDLAANDSATTEPVATEPVATEPVATEPVAAVPGTAETIAADPSVSEQATILPDAFTECIAPLQDHFFSLGTVLLQIQLLSRRRHHYVDPDHSLLGREVRLAADAFLSGNESAARLHLSRCFESLRETREQFYPMNCFLIDICIPGDVEEPTVISRLLQSPHRLNLFATGKDVAGWVRKEPAIADDLRESITEGRLCLLTGHDSETRTSLGSMASTVGDIERCRTVLTSLTGTPPRHWARRRFGLTASLPTLLHYFGFESALHVALDDGLYPDQERSQFDWQAPDGSIIPAASRIPLAIDSASGFLRFADRYNESMQDDSTAALFLARLPTLKSPWLTDLLIAASYAPVLGEFATIDDLCHAAGGSRMPERHEHSDYLSPFLIQSAVLKTEPPVSGPASLRQLSQRLESLRTVLGIAVIIKAVNSSDEITSTLAAIDSDIADLEMNHVDIHNTSEERSRALLESAFAIAARLNECEANLATAVQSKVPSRPGEARGLFLINSRPFGRFAEIAWPESWNSPAKSSVIEMLQRTEDSGRLRLLAKLPPGGFAWLSECAPGQTVHPIMEAVRGDAPLAEPLMLRNRHFEVMLSDRTGGIESVMWHNRRGNRLSQQSCFRFEREQTLPDDGAGEIQKVSYAVSRLVSHRVLEAGMVFASVETVTELVSPVDRTVLATVRQTTSVDRVQPRLVIKLTFENISAAVKGNPWLTYYGCRFAWDNESAAITRAVLGQTGGFRSERFESPDYVEVSDNDHRLVIATHGRPYHRRSGPRMLDSLLIVEGESAREFQFTVEFDQPFPMRTATDVLTPPIIQETSGKVPASASGNWILGLSARNVELIRTDHHAAASDKSEELILLLTETDGLSVRCLVKTARRPTSALAVNADRTEKVSLEITDQGVLVPFNAFQIKCIVLVL